MTKEHYGARTKALIQIIEDAFNGVRRENGVTLHEADVIDDYGDAEARAKARLRDTESRWQDVPHEEIRDHNSSLSFLDAKGFHYYFPAYLNWDLHFMDCEDESFHSDTFNSINCKLLALPGSEIDDLFIENFSLFTPHQKTIVAYYLRFQIERLIFMAEQENLGTMIDYECEGFQHALNIYWNQFL